MDKLENDHYSTKMQCAICLNDFHDGEEICWSQNIECGHVFHHLCIKQWVLRHDDCPCCRNNFLLDSEVKRRLCRRQHQVLLDGNGIEQNSQNEERNGNACEDDRDSTFAASTNHQNSTVAIDV